VETADLSPDTLIGGVYRILRPLGAGGMGIVLLALDQTLDRRVAIKFVRPALLNDRFRERFAAEARAMARVNHPNVLSIYSFGEHESVPYFVMELVEGPTLEQWLVDTPPPRDLNVVLKILDDVCHGLTGIHSAGTVHRDLKPSNILLGSDFRARIADLGLAILADKAETGDAKNQEVVGTPAYMAPETAFPEQELEPALRPRTDVYSLGCMAYELLTGKTPFEAESNFYLMVQHATSPVPPPSTVRDLPPGFDQPILRALAKSPAERTPSSEAFRRELWAANAGTEEPGRILVAEDDPDFREILQIALGNDFPEAEIECVADGQSALEAFDRKRPSVMILDLRMPKLDGLELTGLIRARDSSKTVPIIVLTASGGPDEWRRLSSMGADRFLVKPVALADVVTLVRNALRERSGSVPPVEPHAV
jgi:eukaryotic-like serine/threonine-protein kinase